MSSVTLLRPRTAQAAERPCQLYVHSLSPRPSRTQGHHRHPVYMQNVIFGHIKLPELLWLCGLCHDSVHDWLSFLTEETRRPNPEPGLLAKREAQRTFDWFIQAGGKVEDLR